MKLYKTAIITLVLLTNISLIYGQSEDNPLEQLSFYIGTWGIPLDDAFLKKRPEMKDLKVIDFKWGKDKRVIWSRTGFFSDSINSVMSEGMISYNPTTKKIVWLEYQIDNELLFEGEYRIIKDNVVQRIYNVYYAEGYKAIPNPEVEGWTRKYRETFTPTSDNNIDWLTETYINGEWVKRGPDDTKAVRDH